MGGKDHAKKEKYWGEYGLGPGRRRPSKLGLGSSTARKLETRILWKLAETKLHFPHPGGGGIPGPRSQPWLHKTHFQVDALLPSVNPSRGLPIYSTRDLVRPKPRDCRGGPGVARRLLSWGPCWGPRLWCRLCDLLAFSRSPPTEVKVLRAPGTPRAGVAGGMGLVRFSCWVSDRSQGPGPSKLSFPSTRCLAGHWGLGCRPRFTGAAVMDVG